MAFEGQETTADKLPTSKNEDVEFAAELADADDLEAQERARQADARQEAD